MLRDFYELQASLIPSALSGLEVLLNSSILSRIAAATYIDAHTHVDHYAEPDLNRLLEHHDKHGVLALSNSCTYAGYLVNTALMQRSIRVAAGFGIHPWYTAEAVQLPGYAMEYSEPDFSGAEAGAGGMHGGSYPLEALTRVLNAETAPFIGEIGLDFFWAENKAHYPLQKLLFKQQLRHALLTDKLVTIHTKGAEELVLRYINKQIALSGIKIRGASRPRILIHWYSGAPELIPCFLKLGCVFSVGPDILTGNSLVSEEVPFEQLVCETDGPGSVEWVTGKPGSPEDIIRIYDALAHKLGKTEQAVQQQLKATVRSLFSP